jgi:Protein of unknown function (DUF2789)
MESNFHSFSNLFAQLGLPSNTADIQTFIDSHSPLASDLLLCEAPFWTQTQAKFLREQIALDADWSSVIDKLDARLR